MDLGSPTEITSSIFVTKQTQRRYRFCDPLDGVFKKLLNGGIETNVSQFVYQQQIAHPLDPWNYLLTDNRLLSCMFPQVKETILEQISTVEVNSMQQVTQLSAVVVMATEGEKDIAVTAQVCRRHLFPLPYYRHPPFLSFLRCLLASSFPYSLASFLPFCLPCLLR